MAEQNIYTNITATANFSSLTAQLRAVTAELIKLQATTIGLDRNLSNEVGRMNRSFAETMRATGQFSTHFVTLESDVQKFGKRLDTGRMKLGEYYGVWQGHARKTSTLIKDLAKQQVLMENAVLQPLGRNAQGQMQYNVHVANGLDVLKNRTALLRQEAAILNKVMLDGSNQLINWGKNTQWAGRQLTVGLTVPMMAFGAAAQKAFLEADQQLVRLTKVYGGLGDTSAAELKQVREDVAKTAKELASIYGASYKDTIALSADIAATGKTGNDLLVSTKETTRLAILGEVDRQDAMKATLAIQNAFKQSNDELAKSINFLNAVENQTSTSLADLIEAIPKAGPVIESLGGDIQDLALYLTAMKEGGVNASEGANAIKSSLASLINPTKVAKEMFQGFGIDLEGIVKRNAGNVTGTILELQGALDKLDPLKKSQAIEQLFGKFQFARMNALFANLGKQGSQTLQVLDLMKASSEELANVASRELKQMTESASGQYKRALETIKAELAGVGDQFLKISTFVLNTISGILKFVDNLPGPIKSLLTFLGGLTAFAGPLIMLTGVLGNFLGYIIKGVFHLKQLFKGGSGFKLLTPEMLAAAEAGKVVENSFFSDAQAAIALETAVNNLAASFDRLKASALNSAVATSSSISTMGGSTILSPAGSAANADRVADKDSKFIGAPYSRQFAHTIPSAIEQPGTIFGVVPNPGPVNVRVSNNPQMYMDQDLPRVPGVTSISGVSTGIVAGEAAKWHAMTAAIATQSQAELSLLKTEVAATGTVTHELSSVYQAMLPQMQQLTQLAADEGAMIVRQLQQGVITVDQARAKIISLNATIEVMMAETAAQVAAGMGRGINLTTVPFTSQPTVDPVTGKSNMKEMFHKPETAALVDKVAEGLGVRTSGGGYSIETTKPRIILPKRGPLRGFNDGGYVYTLADGPVVPGDKSVNYDNTMAKIPVGGFVLNQDATRNNPQLVEYAKKSKPYNRGGMIDAMLTPYETVFTPEQTQEMLPILEAANSGQRIQFRNSGGILGGPIVPSKKNYGRFDLLKSLFRRKATASADDLANLSPIMKLGRKTKVSADDAGQYVDETLGAAAPKRRKLGNPDGYFFVGNWGLAVRDRTNTKLAGGTAKAQEIVDDIMSLSPTEALPALTRFLKVNGIDDQAAAALVSEARDRISSNLLSHGDDIISELRFSKAQHPVYLEIAESLGLRKKYLDSLNVPGQRRAFRPEGDSKSGFKAATAINPYSTTDIDVLMAKNAEFGTNFMGSYETFGVGKVQGEKGAFAHMMLDEYAMGGIIGKNKANYGRLFLGMPRSIKQVQEQRRLKKVMEETTEAVNNSRLAKQEPENFGELVSPSTGRSFPVPGIGGVYKKPDGTQVFVKPVLDEKAALAEQRATIIAREAHGLKAPEQQIKVMLDPTDPQGRRKVIVLESKFDDAFAIKDAKFSEDDYFKQLVASALRGDKDLSPDNLSGRVLADVGTAGVFKMASGLRDYADIMPSMADQARINLLGVKGGARRFFAEATVDIPKGMSPTQYHSRMISEIDDVLPRLKDTISKFDLNEEESAIYAAMIQRLEDARHVNWKEFHGIHSAVKPTPAKALTPAALAKIEEAEALKRRQKGHAASLSDIEFKSDANGFNGGGLINIIKSLAMRRIGAGFGKNTTGGWGVTSLEIGMAEKLFASSGLTKRTQKILYDKFAEALAKEMPYGYTKNAQGHLIKALEPDIMDSVLRSAASSTLSAPEGRRILSAIDRDILRKRYTNWESKKDAPLTKELKELIFGLEGREKGGPVSGGTPYIVGEKGPELFVPMNSGGIVPNHALGGMIRGGKYNYGALGPVGSVVAQQAIPLALFMLLPKALEKLGIASEKSNSILNAIFLAMTAGSIYKGVKVAKAAKAAKAATAADDVVDGVTAVAAAEKNIGKFGQTLAKLKVAGKAIPGWGKVAIFTLTTLATVSYGAWENARKARLASQEAFDVNEAQAKQLGIAYTSLTDKIKKATDAAKAQSQLAKVKAAGSTAIGGGINMSVKELNALQKKAKETQGDIVQMFNNLDKNDVTKAATALKVQLVAAGKSAQDAAREIYSIISVSNKAAQATEAVSSADFLKVVDGATAARVAIDTFVKSMKADDVDKKEIAASFSGGLDAIQLYYQSLVGLKENGGKAKTQIEALNETIEKMNALKSNQTEIGDDILNTLVKENPLYKDILSSNDSMVDAWAKIQLYTNGVTANLSDLSGQEAQDLLQVVTAISQAATEMTTNANLMNNPLDAIADYGTAAKIAYDKAKEASDAATKNAQKNADAEIKAIDKKIDKINEEADARIKAIESQSDKQDYLTEVQKEQLNYQQALLAGDMSRAAQSQLNIQSLTNERQKTLAIDSINEKRDADLKKLEAQKASVQERLVKLQERANKLQEEANKRQKEYAQIQSLQQSIAATISKAGMTTDEGVLKTLSEGLRSDVSALAAINADGAKAAASLTKGVPKTAATYMEGPGGVRISQPGSADWLGYLKKLVNDPGGGNNSAVEYAKKYFDSFGTHVDSFGMYVKKLLGLPEVGSAKKFANASGAPVKLIPKEGDPNRYTDGEGKTYTTAQAWSIAKPAEDTRPSYKSFKHPLAKPRGGKMIYDSMGQPIYKEHVDQSTGNRFMPNGTVIDKTGNTIGLWANANHTDGTVVSYNRGGSVKHFEPGGSVTGPGTGTSDSIPAYLSNGEYVIRASAVNQYGKDFFDGLNQQKFANGGAVGVNSSIPLNSGYLNLGGMIPGYRFGGLLSGISSKFSKWISSLFGKKAASAVVPKTMPSTVTRKTLDDFGSDFIIGNHSPVLSDQYASIFNIPYAPRGPRAVAGEASLFHNPLAGETTIDSVFGLPGSNKSALFGIALLESMKRNNRLVLSSDRSVYAERLASLVSQKNLKDLIKVPSKEASSIDNTGNPFAWAYGQANTSTEHLERALNPWIPGTQHAFNPLAPHQIDAASQVTRSLLGGNSVDNIFLRDMLQQYLSGGGKKFANGGLVEIPKFGFGGLASFKKMFASGGKAGASGFIWQLMEDAETAMSLKWGADQDASGYDKWNAAIGRVAWNALQGTLAGSPYAKGLGKPGYVGLALGLTEGLIGLIRDGSQYGVKGGSKATEKGFDPEKALADMSLKKTLLNSVGTGAVSAPFGPLGDWAMPKIGAKFAPLLKKLKTNSTNAITAALLGFGAPFAQKKFSSVLSKPKIKVTADVSDQLAKAVTEDWLEYNGKKIPVYTGGPFKGTSTVYQGPGEDFSELVTMGRVGQVIPTSPEGILGFLVSQRPKDKKLAAMLANFEAGGYENMGPEEIQYLTKWAAATSFGPKSFDMRGLVSELPQPYLDLMKAKDLPLGYSFAGQRVDQLPKETLEELLTLKQSLEDQAFRVASLRAGLPKVSSSKDPDLGLNPTPDIKGVTTLIASMLGDKTAAATVDAKTKLFGPYLTKIQKAYADKFAEGAQARGIDADVDLSQIPMVREYNYGFQYDEFGNIVSPNAGFPIKDSIKSGAMENVDENRSGRVTEHWAIWDAVRAGMFHRGGSSWSKSDTTVVTPLSNLLKTSDFESLSSFDSWRTSPFSKPHTVIRKDASVISGFRTKKDYIAALKERGLYKEGDKVKLITEIPETKEVLYLNKPEYTNAEIDEILAMYELEGSNMPALKKSDAPATTTDGEKMHFEAETWGGTDAYTGQRALHMLAMRKAQVQVGIDQPFREMQRGAAETLSPNTIKAISNLTGIQNLGQHGNTSLAWGEKLGGDSNPFLTLLTHGGVKSKEGALASILMHGYFGKIGTDAYPAHYTLGEQDRTKKIISEWARQAVAYKHGDTQIKPMTIKKLKEMLGRIKEDSDDGFANGGYVGKMSLPKFENGINMVPADMLAMLHKNEAVVPANMNPFNPNANNATMGGAVYNITNNINGADCDINELSDIVTRKTIDSMKTLNKISVKSMGESRSLGSGLEVRV